MSALDRAGVVVSGACCIHCALLPLMLASVPFAGLSILDDARIEWSLIAAAALVGAGAHSHAYLKHHRHVAPAALFVLGLTLVMTVRVAFETSAYAPLVSASGGCLLALAHWINLRLIRRCVTCSAVTVPRSI